MSTPSDDDLHARVLDLERRVAALEGVERANAVEPSGSSVEYRGQLAGPVELEWSIHVDPARVMELDDGPRTDVLAALGHPARAAVVRLLAGEGPQNAAALQAAAGLGSTGQLYHHLKSLTSCGLVEQDKRGSYRLRAQATIPALVLLTAASDVAGQLRR
ncbi:helix-turn-helix transcriptional regulator [Saccharopolyspora erythraea]|uniref:ArsR/SmtB family transcription factor n=1 Tax=Saccharopolyspora erythraea TaxID=1836 RepID=UPI001BAA6937|nr:helix-turn-helix transcriptional regulator [Saccharopolyspora erythraea]QUH01189.1 helix-turn-helix transcriptional regulator [Saccharopolyspora erythraea]